MDSYQQHDESSEIPPSIQNTTNNTDAILSSLLRPPVVNSNVEHFRLEQNTSVDSYYTQWQGHGLNLPEPRNDIREWIHGVGLGRNEDYVLDPRVGSLRMGLGWDKGVDVDASAALFGEQLDLVDVVWFRNLQSKCGSVRHSGDDLTGEGGGDDEIITVNLDSIPLNIHQILFAVTIYTYDRSFDDIRNAYVRMMHGKAEFKGHVMCAFALAEMTGHGLLMGLLTRKGAYWNFRALGQPTTGHTIIQLLNDPANLRCLSQCPSFPPAVRHITVRVTSGRDLAAKDVAGMFRREATSDPYYIIRYKKKVYKSEYQSRTLNPRWRGVDFNLGYVLETERKALKIEVFDFDAVSTDDFMGVIRIPAKALFHAGLGEHKFTFTLGPSKEARYRHEDVSGEIDLTITVTEVQQVSGTQPVIV